MLPDPLPGDPFGLFRGWFEDARAQAPTPNPNAMALATVDPDGRPSVRMVLCKGIDPETGSILFYTNYESRKGAAMEATGRAAVVFHWDAMERQVRIEGRVARATPAESDAYFASRAWESRVGAWASRQSRPVASRQDLMDQVGTTILELGLDVGALMRGEPVEIPRPPFWGGYRLTADRVELWVGGTGRVHDRAAWSRQLAPGGPATRWESTRLQP
ncbi:MAG: pyridoxamine 5'-phosphate oxidase [Phycisphaerales bacterium]|nr:pyridoxamine 5'-phosphate oxidase [Phycisphaerales bacterium]